MDTNFKKGDWVVTHSALTFVPQGLDSTTSNRTFIPNDLRRINRISENDSYDIMFFDNYSVGMYSGNFRLATEEEIRLGKPILNNASTYELW